jgi:hypothetical protein
MKKRDNIYEAFLSAIDEDLRDMCEMNGKVERSLPCPYCGEKNIERLAKSLVGVLEERSPDIPGLVPEQYRADVHEARELLTAATLALLPLYFPPRDSRIGSVATVVSMFRHGRTAGYKSAGVLLFEEVATGMKYSTKQGAYIPSSFVRHTDGRKPCDRLHRDESRGFTADEDDAVMFYKRYLKVQRRVFDTSPRFNFELCVKRPFEALSDGRHTFYYMEEKMEIDLATKVRKLQDRYILNLTQAKGYDLLDKLMINALLAYLRDETASVAARESYLSQTERLIDGVVKFPHTTSPKEGVDVDRIA